MYIEKIAPEESLYVGFSRAGVTFSVLRGGGCFRVAMTEVGTEMQIHGGGTRRDIEDSTKNISCAKCRAKYCIGKLIITVPLWGK